MSAAPHPSPPGIGHGDRLFIAVDGGNSKTDVLIGSTTGDVLGSARGPVSSPDVIGLDGTMNLLDSLITQARAAAGLAPHVMIDRAEIYLAGADLPTEVDALTKAAQSRAWAAEHRVDNDAFALMRAGTDAANALAVVCGAGINCVGRAADGRTARFPALGQISGDWGGGHHLAAITLWQAARGEDGRGPATALTAAVAAHFGTPTVEDVSVGLHLGELPRSQVDDLTTVLFAVANDGDLVARRLVERQADEIIRFVDVAARRLALHDSAFAVVLGGGVLTARHPLLHSAVVTGVRLHAPRAEVTLVDLPPVAGAALLALDSLAGSATAATTLRSTLRGPLVSR
ncbi:N-acetylglucosamine kinase [Phytoactinopolyspora limicola]|uniref:N-acetylglucosamine kinase n=1 Tax=Phytoactinopolyspora limicola TaxID=2715536 RepID=UPI001A9CB143|nr:BadF/BadG/BcrA/BcrD ATPase family protein [Phytoactinopolyspora limicola]